MEHRARDLGAERDGSLEGLRGLAALQVVAMHYVTAFLPGAATRNPALYRHGWEAAIATTPLYFLIDGFTAVYLFFLISGGVLTLSFHRTPRAVLTLTASRLVRLGLPVVAAGVFAWLLTLAAPNAHSAAAALIGPDIWLGQDGVSPTTLVHLLRDVSLNAILLGYAGASVLAPSWSWLQPINDSLDAPFWTMHLEFYGSLLVMAYVAVRSLSRPLYWGLIVCTVAFWLPLPMFLFVIGHLAAGLIRHPPAARAWSLLGGLLLVLGVLVAADKNWQSVDVISRLLNHATFASVPNQFQFQSQIGAIMIYFGVLLCRPVRNALGLTRLRQLGRLSFSLYLVHFPILFTLTCVIAVKLAAVLPLDSAFAVASLAGLTVTAGMAVIFMRWVDRPAIDLSRRIKRRSPIADERSPPGTAAR